MLFHRFPQNLIWSIVNLTTISILVRHISQNCNDIDSWNHSNFLFKKIAEHLFQKILVDYFANLEKNLEKTQFQPIQILSEIGEKNFHRWFLVHKSLSNLFGITENFKIISWALWKIQVAKFDWKISFGQREMMMIFHNKTGLNTRSMITKILIPKINSRVNILITLWSMLDSTISINPILYPFILDII